MNNKAAMIAADAKTNDEMAMATLEEALNEVKEDEVRLVPRAVHTNIQSGEQKPPMPAEETVAIKNEHVSHAAELTKKMIETTKQTMRDLDKGVMTERALASNAEEELEKATVKRDHHRNEVVELLRVKDALSLQLKALENKR